VSHCKNAEKIVLNSPHETLREHDKMYKKHEKT
jgi:hypothetical protein